MVILVHLFTDSVREFPFTRSAECESCRRIHKNHRLTASSPLPVVSARMAHVESFYPFHVNIVLWYSRARWRSADLELEIPMRTLVVACPVLTPRGPRGRICLLVPGDVQRGSIARIHKKDGLPLAIPVVSAHMPHLERFSFHVDVLYSPRQRRSADLELGSPVHSSSPSRLSTHPARSAGTGLRLRKSLARRLIRIAWTPAGKSPIPAWACFPLLAWLWDASQRRAARLYKIPTFLQPPAAIVDYHSSPYLRYRPSSPTARLLADLSARQIARDRRAGTFASSDNRAPLARAAPTSSGARSSPVNPIARRIARDRPLCAPPKGFFKATSRPKENAGDHKWSRTASTRGMTLEQSGNRLRVKTAMRFEIFDAPADALRGPARVVLPLTLHRAESCSGMVDCSGYATATCKYHWRRGMGRKRARACEVGRLGGREARGVKHADIQVEAPERIQVLVLSRKHSDGHAPEVVGQVEMEREIVSLSQISAGSTGTGTSPRFWFFGVQGT
ncbi:hypothetical protein B0H13DRAFT_2321332 [Mycena leptocephala]|nr:hypothetical protein B0H13DRAFT_2321332 [Mycena leptocephala]